MLSGLFQAVPPAEVDELITTAYKDLDNPGPEGEAHVFLYPPDASFMLTAGMDRKLRYWALMDVQTSYIITGLQADEPTPQYRFATRAHR